MKKSENHQPYVIDDTDRQILSLLKDNARIPAKRIAEKTFLSPTAIATRIERLEEERCEECQPPGPYSWMGTQSGST